jgi:hypothetical protein
MAMDSLLLCIYLVLFPS